MYNSSSSVCVYDEMIVNVPMGGEFCQKSSSMTGVEGVSTEKSVVRVLVGAVNGVNPFVTLCE